MPFKADTVLLSLLVIGLLIVTLAVLESIVGNVGHLIVAAFAVAGG